MMDRISRLHDELLLEILSFLPAKQVVDTMFLSKRWQHLWLMVPKLIYDDSYQNIEHGKFSQFVNKSLFMHETPVIETLQFRLSNLCASGDIQVWVSGVHKRRARELIVEISHETPLTLPRSMYTGWKMRVALKLRNTVLQDHVSSPISFPNLKILSLKLIMYPSEEFVRRFLSGCPILEDLVVAQIPNDNVPILSIRVPSLKSLVLHRSEKKVKYDSHGYVIDAPSLEYVDVADYSHAFCVIENIMTKIVKANLVVGTWDPWKTLMDSIVSAKRLYLRIPASKDMYPVGSIFCSLVRLTICTCETEWLNLLIHVLRDSPNLRALRLAECHELRSKVPRPSWNETSLVPEYLLSSLETFEWIDYRGTETEKQVVAFILRIASCLKKATIISSKSITDHKKKLEMLSDFPLSSRRSPTCLLALQWSYVQESEKSQSIN